MEALAVAQFRDENDCYQIEHDVSLSDSASKLYEELEHMAAYTCDAEEKFEKRVSNILGCIQTPPPKKIPTSGIPTHLPILQHNVIDVT